MVFTFLRVSVLSVIHISIGTVHRFNEVNIPIKAFFSQGGHLNYYALTTHYKVCCAKIY